MAHVKFRKRLHPAFRGQLEELLLQQVVVLEAILPAGGVQDPVADIDEVQQPPEFLVAQFDVHRVDQLLSMMSIAKRVSQLSCSRIYSFSKRNIAKCFFCLRVLLTGMGAVRPLKKPCNTDFSKAFALLCEDCSAQEKNESFILFFEISIIYNNFQIIFA